MDFKKFFTDNKKVQAGIEKAWEALSGLRPEEVSRNALAKWDGEGFTLISLGMEFYITPAKREIKGQTPEADAVAKKLGYFFNHSALWYLAGAKDIGLAGRLIRPSDVKGGHHFFRGTHELPLENLARKYGGDKDGFLRRGERLGGRALSLGDASVKLLPFPRIPITIVLWLGDDEFPPRADLFFDSTCEFHMPLDIIWSTAMFTVLAMINAEK